jgi:hypothetical protein
LDAPGKRPDVEVVDVDDDDVLVVMMLRLRLVDVEEAVGLLVLGLLLAVLTFGCM